MAARVLVAVAMAVLARVRLFVVEPPLGQCRLKNRCPRDANIMAADKTLQRGVPIHEAKCVPGTDVNVGTTIRQPGGVSREVAYRPAISLLAIIKKCWLSASKMSLVPARNVPDGQPSRSHSSS